MKKIATYLLAFIILAAACKKGTQLPVDNNGNNTTGTTTTGNTPIVLPDSVIVTSGQTTYAANPSTGIQLINATDGSVITTYTLPNDPSAAINSMQPFIGNNFLYEVDNDKIIAMNITTGATLWTDSVKNFTSVPPSLTLVATNTILHNDTFYALYMTNSATQTYMLCAIDATKKSTTPLWKYTFTVSDVVPAVTYYNGSVYLSTAFNTFFSSPAKLTALDAKTGNLKWTISNSANFSLASINYGFVTVGNTVLDAASGNQVAAVTGFTLPPVTSKQTTSVALATSNALFTTTSITGLSPVYVSMLNSSNQALKWKASLDSVTINPGFTFYNLSLSQVLNNELLTQTQTQTTVSGAGTNYGYSYSALDITSGQTLWSYTAPGQSSYAVVNNILYTYGNNYGTGFGTVTVAPILSSVDMRTGKAKWTNKNVAGNNFCMYVSGKAYSPYIQ